LLEAIFFGSVILHRHH